LPAKRNAEGEGSAMNVPEVSVVVPNYNYAPYLENAIDSVLAQTFESVEVLVVDDGSTDESLEVLRGYEKRVRVFSQSNQGVSAARNKGISESRGKYIAFLDADDSWHPSKLKSQLEYFSDPAVGMVYCRMNYTDLSGKVLCANGPGEKGHVLREIAFLRGPGVPAGGSAAIVRRECFETVGLFETKLSTTADWDMWRRIACRYKIELVASPLVYYRLHPTAMHRNLDVFEHDMLLAVERMFDDPAASEVHQYRRTCYGNLYLTLSGSFLYGGRWARSLKYATLGLLKKPTSICFLATWPFRFLRRRMFPEPIYLRS
jgi:glycosyltransferase involved in cell wall biosynthesis